jgi:hypothetical protein
MLDIELGCVLTFRSLVEKLLAALEVEKQSGVVMNRK